MIDAPMVANQPKAAQCRPYRSKESLNEKNGKPQGLPFDLLG